MRRIRRLDTATDEIGEHASCSGCVRREWTGRPTHSIFTSRLIIVCTNASPSIDHNRIASAACARRSPVQSGNWTAFVEVCPTLTQEQLEGTKHQNICEHFKFLSVAHPEIFSAAFPLSEVPLLDMGRLPISAVWQKGV
jgi:hypothetical protein